MNTEQLAQGCYIKVARPGVVQRPHERKSNVLTITLPRHTKTAFTPGQHVAVNKVVASLLPVCCLDTKGYKSTVT